MSKFMQFAVAATQEALDDAAWHPEEEPAQEATVRPNIQWLSIESKAHNYRAYASAQA